MNVGDIITNRANTYRIIKIDEGVNFAGANKNWMREIETDTMVGWLSDEQIDRGYKVLSSERKPNTPKCIPYEEGLI